MRFFSTLVLGSNLARLIQGQVVGESFGMAAGTTGGGNAEPAAPANITELAKWLSDDVPRVILIDKEFDFIGSEGVGTDSGCEPTSCPMSKGGQGYLGTISCGGDNKTPVSSISYDKAGTNPLMVASNKSIVGVDGKGVIKGKGLRVDTATNIIIQNIHITNINPQYVWGGDAITLGTSDKIWIDHCKFSLVGRQMLVAGWEPAGHVTVSNCEFDGNTEWSASCNGQHYWGMLMIGRKDYYTLSGNYFHHLSGRAPHYGTDKDGATNVFHAVNNFFDNMSGHAFDIEPSTFSVLEGNAFNNVSQPLTPYSTTRDNQIFVAQNGSGSQCESVLGRSCVDNLVTGNSGELPVVIKSEAVRELAADGKSIAPAMSPDKVPAWVKANAGIGKLSSVPVYTTPVTASTAMPTTFSAANTENTKSTSSASITVRRTTFITALSAATPTGSSSTQRGKHTSSYHRCGVRHASPTA